MELLKRYLQAVSFWLPKQQKVDIIAELSEDLHSQIEEQQAALGRPLHQAEIESILKRCGRPVLVANRYLPQAHLIGPLLFPIYRFILKILFVFYLIPWLLVWIGLTTFTPVDRFGHALQPWTSIIGSFWSTAFVITGTVTVVFAILERVQTRSGFLENWNPSKLPPVRDANLITRSASSVDLAANLIFLLWWAGQMYSPIVIDRPKLSISLSPLWHYFFWAFLVLGVVNSALAALNLMRPYWTRFRATLRLLADFAGAAIFSLLLRSNILAGIVIPNVSSARTMEVTDAVNLWMGRMLPGALIVTVIIAMVDVSRIARLQGGNRQPPWQTTLTTTLFLLVFALGFTGY